MADASHTNPLALLLDSDLFFVAKVGATLKQAGYTTQAVRVLADFQRALDVERPAVALVNTAVRGIDWRGGIAAARAAGVPVIAFGAHVDLETQAAARSAGATRVIANSKLASDLPGIVARAVRLAVGPDAPDAQ
jgi:DNA-binding response OmpR family regulator